MKKSIQLLEDSSLTGVNGGDDDGYLVTGPFATPCMGQQIKMGEGHPEAGDLIAVSAAPDGSTIEIMVGAGAIRVL